MKVKELMATLQGLDPEEEVWVAQERGDYGRNVDAYPAKRAEFQLGEKRYTGSYLLVEDERSLDEDSETAVILVIN